MGIAHQPNRANRQSAAGRGGVEALLGVQQTLRDEHLDRVGRVTEEERQLLALRRREVLEDEVGRVLPSGRPTDADPHPQVVTGAERLRDRAQPVVAALTPTQLEPDVTRRDVELVVDDDEPLRARSRRTP